MKFNKNYSKISTKNNKQDNAENVTEEDVKNEEVEVKEKEEVKEEKKEVTGKVNAVLLNVRKEPSKESKVIKQIKKHDEVVILEDANKEFYKIKCKNKEGYCMKQFITL